MTRRSPSGRTTPKQASGPGTAAPGGGGGSARRATPPAGESSLASLRRRQPLAFWMAVLGALAVILATFGSLLSAFS